MSPFILKFEPRRNVASRREWTGTKSTITSFRWNDRAFYPKHQVHCFIRSFPYILYRDATLHPRKNVGANTFSCGFLTTSPNENLLANLIQKCPYVHCTEDFRTPPTDTRGDTDTQQRRRRTHTQRRAYPSTHRETDTQTHTHTHCEDTLFVSRAFEKGKESRKKTNHASFLIGSVYAYLDIRRTSSLVPRVRMGCLIAGCSGSCADSGNVQKRGIHNRKACCPLVFAYLSFPQRVHIRKWSGESSHRVSDPSC